MGRERDSYTSSPPQWGSGVRTHLYTVFRPTLILCRPVPRLTLLVSVTHGQVPVKVLGDPSST